VYGLDSVCVRKSASGNNSNGKSGLTISGPQKQEELMSGRGRDVGDDGGWGRGIGRKSKAPIRRFDDLMKSGGG